jgi:hypothetical protein
MMMVILIVPRMVIFMALNGLFLVPLMVVFIFEIKQHHNIWGVKKMVVYVAYLMHDVK